MTTRRVIVAGLVSVAIVGVWLALRVAPATTGAPGLTLLVNLRSRIEITPGTPLVFELSLGSSPSSARLDVGSWWKPWHELVRLEGPQGQTTLPWQIARAGAPRSMHVVKEGDGRPDVTEDTSAVARLERGQHVHTVMFASGPEDTAGMEPGAYRIRGVVETPSWLRWGWTGRAGSSPVTVVVTDPSDAGDRRPQLEARRLAGAAEFYLNAGRSSEAHALAAELTALKSEEARSFIILGDALAALERRPEALDAYRRAMTLIPPSSEEPTLLMERIKSVVDRTGR